MNFELKPCPFCGKESQFVGTERQIELDETIEPYGYFTVCCSYNRGGCGAMGGYRQTTESAIKAWNTRNE